MARPMLRNLEEIEQSDAELLRPCDVAGAMGVHPYYVNKMVENGKCPFPAFMSGNRVKIPRKAFIAWYYGGHRR